MRKAIQVLLGLALLAAPLAAAALIARSMARWFDSLDQDNAVTVIGVVAVVGVPILTYFTNRILERRRAVEAATRSKRVELYEEFFAFFGRMFTPASLGKQPTADEVVEFLSSMTPRMMAHASNDVIKRWGRLRVAGARGPLPAGDTSPMVAYEDLMKAMRKDLGHSPFGVQRRDILRLFVNDIDTMPLSARPLRSERRRPQLK